MDEEELLSRKKIVRELNFNDITSLDLIKALDESFFVATDYRMLFIANIDYSETRKENSEYQDIGLEIEKFERLHAYVQT